MCANIYAYTYTYKLQARVNEIQTQAAYKYPILNVFSPKESPRAADYKIRSFSGYILHCENIGGLIVINHTFFIKPAR